MDSDHPTPYLTGKDLAGALSAAVGALERNAGVINAMNVFPVPDGDTGTNMWLTLKETVDAVAPVNDATASEVLQGIARGALLSARGNSGVILSQCFRGLAQGMDDKTVLTGSELARALRHAGEGAYRAVSHPAEGTMLTVIREAGEAAAEHAAGSAQATAYSVLDAACRRAQESLARTPELLPVLREAGVVDAGGQGLVVVLEAMRRYLAGEVEPAVPDSALPQRTEVQVREEFLHTAAETQYGYCIQFLIQGQIMDQDAVRDALDKLATSTIVIGDSETVRVHVHAVDPGPVLSYAAGQGTLAQVRIDNMDEQHQGFRAVQAATVPQAVGVVAVSWGSGMTANFRNLGAETVECGETMNPSVQDILHAAQRIRAREVILLPNNPNVVQACRQAAELSEGALLVVPTQTLPQGIAAMLAFNPERSAQKNCAQMEDEARSVRTIEVTRAVRGTEIDGVVCRENQVIAFLDGRLVVAGDDEVQTLHHLLQQLELEHETLITLYYGREVSAEQAGDIAHGIEKDFPECQVEVVHGGQPLYPYLVSVE